MSSHSFDRGSQDDGTLTVSIERFYGDDYVTLDLIPGVSMVHLDAEGARAVAADLLAHADRLDGGS